MISIELDWAGDELPQLGVLSEYEAIVVVALEEQQGPTGWPVVRVTAIRTPHAELRTESMALDGWLKHVYGVENDEEREDLLSLAS